jgi:hypothetical protein
VTSRTRWWLLAEDKHHESLALRLADKLGLVGPISVSVAPGGVGAASAWVVRQYAKHVRNIIRKRPSERVALLVLIDGDNQGVVRRKLELDTALREAGEQPRAKDEPIVFLVPTWSIETWLITPPAQTESETVKPLLREPTRAHFQQAVARLVSNGAGELPSLIDGSAELRRIA